MICVVGMAERDWILQRFPNAAEGGVALTAASVQHAAHADEQRLLGVLCQRRG